MMQALLQIGAANAFVATAAAVIAALVGRICRRPALAHALWLLVLLKLLTPPIVQVPFRILPAAAAEAPARQIDAAIAYSFVEPVSTAPAVIAEMHGSTTQASIVYASGPHGELLGKFTAMRKILTVVNLQMLLCIVWCTGSVVTAIVVLTGVLRFERLLTFLKPAPPEISERIGVLSRRLRLRRPPPAFLTPGEVCPMLWAGLREPRLLLPVELWNRLDARQRDAVLLHELAHLRRRDHWVRWLEAAATIAFWWFPVCWWARRELREAEEQCCDAWVLRMSPGNSRCYASALLAAAEFVSFAPPLLASGIGQFKQLKRRLTLIQRGNVPQTLDSSGIWAAVAFGMFFIPLIPVLGRGSVAPDQYSSTARSSPAFPQSAAKAQSPLVEEHRAELQPDDLERRMDAIEARATRMLEEVRQLRSASRAAQSRPSRE